MKTILDLDCNISKITLACFVRAGTGNHTHTNRPSHGIAIFPEGQRTFLFEGSRRLTVGEKTLVYFPKDSNYVIHEQQSADCFAINFEMDGELPLEPLAFQVENSLPYLDHFKISRQIWELKGPGYHMKVKSELYSILYRLQQEFHARTDSPGNRQLQAACHYIQSHCFQEEVTVSQLAEYCQISQVYLRKLFRTHLGISPNRYIKSIRLQRARELLRSGLYTVSEVCYLAGFQDESYFSREFKRDTQTTPGQFRRSGTPE